MIRTHKHIVVFAAFWTLAAVATCCGVVFGLFALPVSARTVFATVVLPVCVVPVASFFSGRLLLRLHQLSQKLQHAVDHDALTSTVTRQHFFQHLQSLAPDEESSILMVDVDQFKAINDTHGHFVGDVVLREVAHRLINNTRRNDLVARFGSEEFIVLLPNTSREDAALVAERMRATVSRTPIRTSVSKIVTTVSIGIGHMSEAQNAQAALQEADDALYAAKTAGCNLVRAAA
ncbi:MAG: GGDEF domain-containing protein [Shimia sp.]|uniref:GGDEF domain-containing protein n=1 Tax=Shimia sp. TaxID=1954381 RepID=UPI001B000FAB|nr:GGDEF domain-containing protein [Shimia sp.]MBO6897264.1 GGDEF domain-containing protein [Shimia sp.]